LNQQTDELLETESLEPPVLDVRDPRFIQPKHARRGKLVHRSNLRKDRPS
jgi:hypothetical protein